MKTICVLQHTEAEFLGLMEDHFEGRNIRFSYQRPFTPGGNVPAEDEGYDGLILLGGGPYGVVSGHLLPSLLPELKLTKAFLDAGKPVVGLGLGALILSIAGGGGAEEAPLRFTVSTAARSRDDALMGHLPETFPYAAYLRDKPVLPEGAEVLAAFADGEPAIFSVNGNSLGFIGHPGMKSGMLEDVIMEFVEVPEGTAERLGEVRAKQADIATALTEIMVGLNLVTGWM